MAIEIHAWIEPFDAPEVGADGRLVAEADLLPGMWQGPHQLFELMQRRTQRTISWGDHTHLWVRPRRGNEFAGKEMRLLEQLITQMLGKKFYEQYLGLFDAPHFALFAARSDSWEDFLGRLERHCAVLRGELIFSGAPDLVSFYRESSR